MAEGGGGSSWLNFGQGCATIKSKQTLGKAKLIHLARLDWKN